MILLLYQQNLWLWNVLPAWHSQTPKECHTYFWESQERFLNLHHRTGLLPNIPNTPPKMHCYIRHRSAEAADSLPKKNLPCVLAHVGCLCVHVHVRVHVHMQRPGVDPVCLPPTYIPPYSFWPRISQWSSSLSWLAAQYAPGILLSPFPQHWQYQCVHSCPDFYIDTGSLNQILMFAQQALYHTEVFSRLTSVWVEETERKMEREWRKTAVQAQLAAEPHMTSCTILYLWTNLYLHLL